ncbi:MAG TPA: LuxR C-terminal-related transcriptional regulator, partial [Humibacillus xanthopallidus]|nr:LuxR C-terminal-related transcriptional regulator [Humibacillus xanthopallidus]
ARELASDPLLRADIDRLRARIEIYVGSATDAHRIFTVGARNVADHDDARALEMAVAAAMTRTYGGDSGAVMPPDTLARLLVPGSRDTPRTACLRLLLEAMTASADTDWASATATLDRALVAGRQVEDLDVLGNLGNAALHLGHDAGARSSYAAMVSAAREQGAGMVVIYGLQRLAFAHFPAGDWNGIRACADEALTLARSVGQPTLTAAPLAWFALLSALTGSDELDDRLGELDVVVAQHPLGILTDPVHDLTRWAKGTRAAATGDATAALHHFEALRVPALQRMTAVDRIDAGVRAGGRAGDEDGSVAGLTSFAAASRLPWALADSAFARAVAAAEPARASEEFERAVGLYRQAHRPYAQARAELAYGEFLRRTNRRVDARAHLRSAVATFADLGAGPLLGRAEQELRASGETARKRDPSTLLDLTPMERKVAELVGTGLSNKDVAAQCWVSPRTVAFHLRNVFTKLGITSRTELARIDFS